MKLIYKRNLYVLKDEIQYMTFNHNMNFYFKIILDTNRIIFYFKKYLIAPM